MTTTNKNLSLWELAYTALGEIVYSTRNKRKLEPQVLVIQKALERLAQLEKVNQIDDSEILQHWLNLEEKSNISAYACLLDIRRHFKALEKQFIDDSCYHQFTYNILTNRVGQLKNLIEKS
jgi:hypothetical protein